MFVPFPSLHKAASTAVSIVAVHARGEGERGGGRKDFTCGMI